MRYRRAQVKGGTYFFTVVTHRREKIFNRSDNVELLRQAFKKVIKGHPFKIDAFVLLPDHLHCIWTLPRGDADFPTRWRLIKSHFSRNCNMVGWVEARNPTRPNASRLKKKEKPIWQRRFWEHLIRNNNDLKRHIEYIHYNPVKHRMVKAPKDWQYSSFHRFASNGLYHLEWGAGVIMEFSSNLGYE
ncbi:MAG: transposase [Deltaproteobacteria bacterium]|nr:transposase [Deltaproteobacteria bacterium]